MRALVPGLSLSLRDLEEMMAERGIAVDHTTIHRWTVRYTPLLLERFNRRTRTVTGRWYIDETYIKVRGQWMYLYRFANPPLADAILDRLVHKSIASI